MRAGDEGGLFREQEGGQTGDLDGLADPLQCMLGTPFAQYRGGIGPQSAALLKEFANAGGTLLFLNGATEYAISRLGVSAKTVTPTGGRGGRGGG